MAFAALAHWATLTYQFISNELTRKMFESISRVQIIATVSFGSTKMQMIIMGSKLLNLFVKLKSPLNRFIPLVINISQAFSL